MSIDVHGHVTSPRLFERFPMPPSLADIDGMIEAKAAVGITLTVVGSPVGAGTMVPVPGLDNYRQPADELRAFHDWLAEQIRARSTALRGYVYVNPLGGAAELAEAAQLLKQPEFVGLIVNSSVNGEFLDTPRAADFFAMAAESGAPVLLHPPAEPAAGARLRDPRLVEHVARPSDVAVGTAAVLFAGWLERHPQLRIIAPTAGGGLPLLLEKLDLAHRLPRRPGPPAAAGRPPLDPAGPDTPPLAERPPTASLGQVYVDTATPSLPALAAALAAFGPRNLLFGTDTPPLGAPLGQALALLDRLGLSEADRALVGGGNAAELFGLDAEVLS
ncbi:amidohydrolase family protein [Kitasatospora viridis]|uniref:Aminocarboxymuconate-semialdehyde decarboxylase n=1 Tax=Kitasatospora viridis TaxID=281105 RepID=A0A561UCJ1_9ACTN|nr:amidohydrolase family protein [Kitasatospora viridis]TWF97069.1 aminocarboxymuconate-semialdehyde decarboxylase [Kitasatospora viridis]